MSASDVRQLGQTCFAANMSAADAQEYSGSVAAFQAAASGDPGAYFLSLSSSISRPPFVPGMPAWQATRSASVKIKPGAQAALEKKALQLTGSPSSAAPPAGRTVYGWHVAEGRADIFLTYCTNALAAQKENPGQQIVALPDNLAVGADYGLTVITSAAPAAQGFAQFIMAPDGQKILVSHGFAAGQTQ